MTMNATRVAVLLLLALAAAPAFASGSPVPLGHPDFYPSSERPVGWRGDGTGAWPGATPVREWDAATGKNVVWKVPMPGPSFSQPIVVADKVFTLADPNWLICLGAADGRILWQKQVDHTAAMPPDVAAKAREAEAFWDDQFSQYAVWLDLQRGFHPSLPQEQIDRALKAAAEHDFAINAPGQANFNMISRSDGLWARCLKDQAAYSLYAFGHWEGLLTHTFPTPVSDGESVFVNMSNDQVACYDLEGNRRWLVWDRPRNAKPDEQHVRYSMSPLLIGDKLIVAACGELRAYDKHTGRKLWGVFQQKDFGMYWVKVGTPVSMRLELDGRPLEVILSPGSGIYRADDGRRVGTLPPLTGYEGSTALTDGKIYVRKDAPDSGDSVRIAGRFKAVSADQVEFEDLWRVRSPRKSGANNASDVLCDGWIYSPQEGHRIALADGRTEPLSAVRMDLCSPALGGDLLVTLRGGSYGPREKQPGVMAAQVIDLADGNKVTSLPAAFVDRRCLEDQDYRLKWRWRGNGDSMSNSSPMFQANRMFFRTAGYLWCVGDRHEPWPTPAHAPPAARVRP